jgi:hypothetical protein
MAERIDTPSSDLDLKGHSTRSAKSRSAADFEVLLYAKQHVNSAEEAKRRFKTLAVDPDTAPGVTGRKTKR